tara:strand:+ start:565 stop:711 length:147 start_codon:yes stop_codon:yes gene_type:complete
MDFDYLFYQDFPKGIKTVYVNGKRITIKEFEKAREKYFSKKGIEKLNK